MVSSTWFNRYYKPVSVSLIDINNFADSASETWTHYDLNEVSGIIERIFLTQNLYMSQIFAVELSHI